LKKVKCATITGIEAETVEVEVNFTRGVPKIYIVGLAASEIQESRERFKSALLSTGFILPNRIVTINLSPSDLKKTGSFFDFPFALMIALFNYDEVDLKTSVHILSFNLMPSVFFYYNFGEISGKNTIVFEMFAGVGTTFYFGQVKEFFYPTLEEFQNEQNGSNEIPPQFQINEQGLIAYIGEAEDLGFGIGVNLNYGIKLKYIYQNYNFHIIYRIPTVVTSDEYLNIQQILIGFGYSF